MHPDAEETADLPADGRQQRGDRQAEKRGKRQGARPDPERQHRLHSAEDSDTHRAGGQKAVKDRDSSPGLQLHRPLGQRAACRGGPE